MVAAPRTALLAGATGLVGRSLLSLLLASDRYRSLHVLLRRTPPDTKVSAKLKLHEIDFARLPATFPSVDDVFVALGTTIKLAGSEAAFRQVDFDFVVNVARAARGAGAIRLGVVSALGADPTSRIFYNRVKGEMEIAVMQLGYETVVIAQPSLLLGDRAALGQPTRTSETWAGRLLAPLGWIMPKGVRPIPASTVASALLAAILDAKPGVRVVKSGAMQSSPGSETTFAA
ncbi:MAG: NAD-dependent epimerase/dehydratase family protein [Betaproteobacteria bacterium]|nr:MAG: NAD-dependent epimerase/dehydratase family protein [Betaproteobacteria bacterium]